QLHRLVPGAYLLERINPDQEIQLVRLLEIAFQAANSINRIVRLTRVRVQQRRHKARVVGRGQSQHGKAMLEISELALLLVRRQISRSKVNPVKIKLFRCCARYGQMAKMHGIESSAEQSNLHFLSLRSKPLECLSLAASIMLLNRPLGVQAGLAAFFMRLSALPFLKRCAFGNALHALSFLFSFAAADGFLSDRWRFLLVSSSADFCHTLAQSVLQFRYAFSSDGGNLVEVELKFFRVLAQFGNLLRIGHIHL